MSRRLSRMAMSALWCALAAGGCSRTTDRQPVAEARSTDKGVHLSPNPAFTGARIDVSFEDPWIDPARCRFQWMRNGFVIQDASTGALDPVFFSKGDRIEVTVMVEDSTKVKSVKLHAGVAVANTPPRVSGTTLTMTAPSGVAELRSIVTCTDTDRDSVSYSYRWFRNGIPIDGASGSSLAASSFAHGDRLAVEVVASDHENDSPPFRSEPYEIENLPPRFSSQPVLPRANDEAFRYQATAVDPDGDPLRFELVSAPVGMIIEPKGQVFWPLPPAYRRAGNYPVSIRVTDAKGGEAIQEFSLPLD